MTNHVSQLGTGNQLQSVRSPSTLYPGTSCL